MCSEIEFVGLLEATNLLDTSNKVDRKYWVHSNHEKEKKFEKFFNSIRKYHKKIFFSTIECR